MRYFDAYRFVFKSPNWLKLLGIGALASFVPIVGALVFSGYLWEQEAALRHTGDEKPRDFDFNRLMPYLMRGLWPFLVQMVVGLVANLILVPVLIGTMFGCIAAFGMPEGIFVSYAFIIPLSILFGCLLQVIVIPMSLRSAYHMDFGSGFDMTYLKDFLHRVWKETLLSQLFLAVTAMGLVFVGLLMCFVGVYFTAVLIQFAQFHLMFQLQKLYEERGGMPLTFKAYEPGSSQRTPPPAWRDEREGVFRPDQPPPGPDTGIQGKETGFKE
jgi:hypothetical protein